MNTATEVFQPEVRPATLGGAVLALVLLVLLVLGGLVLSVPGQAKWIVLVSATFPVTSVLLQSGIERLLPAAGPRKGFQQWLLHFQVNTFFSFMRMAMPVAAFLAVAAIAHNFGFELGIFDLRFADGSDILLLIASLWLASVLGDFFFYWYHRWTHVNQFLWQHHKMHHTDTELEAISTARQNWMEAVLNSLFIAVPMIVLFKVDPLEQWHAGLTLSHMNIRLHTGWFARLWCGPQNHRIHHSLEPQHIDKNFAFMFPVWDIIFGTYYHPKSGEYPATGVAGEPGFESFLEAETYSQREMWKWLKGRKAAS
jgi:sterol desaturase/sphingolipid hydroxylase (fatty acid hydroxylase superfamily)